MLADGSRHTDVSGRVVQRRHWQSKVRTEKGLRRSWNNDRRGFATGLCSVVRQRFAGMSVSSEGDRAVGEFETSTARLLKIEPGFSRVMYT